MKAFSKLVVTTMVSISLLVGCNPSNDEAISQSKKIAETAFKEKQMKTTESTNGIRYYLPKGFNVENEMENNIILLKGKEEYILFVNPEEPFTSEVVFNEMKSAKENAETDTFKTNDRFGYISINPAKDKKFELIVGIGGVKMTTLTSANNMVENTKDMMEIANSVQYANEKDKQTEADLEKKQETDKTAQG